MKLKITGQTDGKSVPITVPIEKVIEAFLALRHQAFYSLCIHGP